MISRKCFEVMPAATPGQATVAGVEGLPSLLLDAPMAGSELPARGKAR
jgi:hypothetical protein